MSNEYDMEARWQDSTHGSNEPSTEVDSWPIYATKLEAALAASRAETAAAVAALEKTQWHPMYADSEFGGEVYAWFCVVCAADRNDGHDEQCVVGLALKPAAAQAYKAEVARAAVAELLSVLQPFWHLYYEEIGHYEGATPEFTCIRTEDAVALEPLAERLDEVLARLAQSPAASDEPWWKNDPKHNGEQCCGECMLPCGCSDGLCGMDNCSYAPAASEETP